MLQGFYTAVNVYCNTVILKVATPGLYLVFVQWSHANDLVQDINFPINMLYARTLHTVSFLFNDMNAIEKLETVIRNRSYDGQFSLTMRCIVTFKLSSLKADIPLLSEQFKTENPVSITEIE